MAIASNAKTKVYIGTTVSASSLAEFDADTFVEIKEIEDAGTIGDTASEIKAEFLGDGRVRKFKGARDAGNMKLSVGYDALDAGQSALRAAALSDVNYNFRVVLNDKPDATGTATEVFFSGLVMSSETGLGQSKDIVKQSFDIAVNSELIMVPAELGV